MKFSENHSLKSFNTFGINVQAAYFQPFSTTNELIDCLKHLPTKELLVLGGGSNVLFTKNISETVLLNKIKGIELISSTEDHVFVKVGAGETWHEFVLYCISKNWCGVENLSLIPGSVGASPMQNIGAYGVEIKDVFHELEAIEISTGKMHIFKHEECQFGYRESVFKHSLKNKFIITSVVYKLSKNPHVSTGYGAIQHELNEKGITNPTIKDVSDAVISIRQSKLPDPLEIGNAGSFFKNPVVSNSLVEKLKEEYPNMPVYKLNEQESKLPAGWLIEQAGWKGKTFDNCGVHKNQALVLVNYGGAKGKDIEQLSNDLMADIYQKFSIQLEREVNIY